MAVKILIFYKKVNAYTKDKSRSSNLNTCYNDITHKNNNTKYKLTYCPKKACYIIDDVPNPYK